MVTTIPTTKVIIETGTFLFLPFYLGCFVILVNFTKLTQISGFSFGYYFDNSYENQVFTGHELPFPQA